MAQRCPEKRTYSGQSGVGAVDVLWGWEALGALPLHY